MPFSYIYYHLQYDNTQVFVLYATQSEENRQLAKKVQQQSNT